MRKFFLCLPAHGELNSVHVPKNRLVLCVKQFLFKMFKCAFLRNVDIAKIRC